MLKRHLKWILPIGIIGLGAIGYSVVQMTKPETIKTKAVDAAPSVNIALLEPITHQVAITGFGEVAPLEVTALSTQVSGEVLSWHPNFVPGGVVKRGDILFSIEDDNYQAAVLQAQAELAQSKAALIEERAKAKVAEQQAKKIKDRQVSELYLRKPQVLSAEARVKSAQAGLKRAKRDLDNCKVLSPYDALVVSRTLGVGQFVTSGTQVAMINSIESAEIMLPIAGFDSPFLPVNIIGTRAKVLSKGRIDVMRDGVIVRDLGIVDSATRMVNMVVRVADPYAVDTKAAGLPFGSYVEVQFNGATIPNVFKVPQELVKGDRVWLVDENDTLYFKQVNVIRQEQAYFYIDSGVESGDRLVLTPPEFPQVGMKVSITGIRQPIGEPDDE
jgi:RND family efflux transporter MFP subunit